MSDKSPRQGQPLLPLLLLHATAGAVCFAFFTIVPIGACIILMAVGNDPGGPMFFPIFVIGVILFAATLTAFLGSAALLSDLLRRRHPVPLWLPPLAVFVLATGAFGLFGGGAHIAVPPLAGGVVTMAFIVHWAAISTVWFLPRLLFRLFHVPHAPPKGQQDGV